MLLDKRSFDADLSPVAGPPDASPPEDGPPEDAPPEDGAPAWARDIPVAPGADLWVFAYGSLMWNPGFPVVDQDLAVLHGYHRRFCIASHRYRGTPERPGLVLGLDHGGSCRGMVFRVAAADVPATLDYLWDREMINRTYRPRLLPVRLDGGGLDGGGPNGGGRRVERACAFVVDRAHRQYCGCLDEAHMAERIAGCRGERGPNIDYLVNTLTHLERLGIHDARMARLMAAVRRLTG